MEQKELNRKLWEICNSLKSIPIIGVDYMEYVSALIYAIYENKKYFKSMLEEWEKDIFYVMNHIDYELDKIRQEEKSRELFANISFRELLNRENEVVLKNIVRDFSNFIERLEGEKGKQKLAEAFEYILMKAAQNDEILQKSGEYYTPKGIAKVMVQLLNIKDHMAIYNPACGIGNLITESAKHGEIYVFGEESGRDTYSICMTNLWLHDVYNKRIVQESRELFQLADLAIANPPFSENTEINKNIGQSYISYDIWLGASNYTRYLIKMLTSVNRDGKIAMIVPYGFLFKKTIAEYEVRKRLIKDNYVEAVIGLPEKLFYKTKLPVVILVINKAKRTKETLFIDASREYTKKRKTNILTVEDQNRILDIYQNYQTIPNYSYVAKEEEIWKNNYDLTIKKYVKIQEEKEEISQKETEEKIEFLEQKRSMINLEIKTLIKEIKNRVF